MSSKRTGWQTLGDAPSGGAIRGTVPRGEAQRVAARSAVPTGSSNAMRGTALRSASREIASRSLASDGWLSLGGSPVQMCSPSADSIIDGGRTARALAAESVDSTPVELGRGWSALSRAQKDQALYDLLRTNPEAVHSIACKEDARSRGARDGGIGHDAPNFDFIPFYDDEL